MVVADKKGAERLLLDLLIDECVELREILAELVKGDFVGLELAS